MIKVLVFGVFDGIHDGHRAFFKQAKEHGEHLMVAVAQDNIVAELKKAPPRHTLEERIEMLREEGLANDVIPGDTHLGEYKVIHKEKPQVIALGYDQIALRHDIEAHLGEFPWHIDIVVLSPHKPDTHHNSILTQRS